MKKIYESMLNKSLPVFLFLNLSCAIVTINVYFPAEEVKDVFQSLEDELLEGIETEGAPDDTATEPQPKSHLYPSEPTLRHNKVIATKRVFLLVTEAYAQGSLTQEILNSIKSNPVVQKAYERRNARQSAVNKILSKRLAGEGNRGMLVKRGTLSSSDNKTVNDENS
ncbi:MAG: hypothetical protein GTN99_01760, partial [Candidatus Dadabacteria bacterium]|nr:hypothetical protein [Candidatus Dadabacteria bacterium]NIT12998.1 hypothetical protein [Candidatus Dadabacteria bacterium]